ncbi:MAG: CPBP family intramembrane metalloprotease [Clostridiales bacterium]|nr:CPBP family intramembrane metalloprotease [Clostridiales bacterium]
MADLKTIAQDREKDRRKFRAAYTAPALGAASMLLMLAVRYVDSSVYTLRDNIYLSVIIIQLMVFVLPGIFRLRLMGTGAIMHLNFKPIGIRHLRFITDAALSLVGITILMKLIMYRFGVYSGEFTFFGRFVPYGSIRADFAGLSYLVLAFAVLPAAAEEFVFRSLIFCEYRDMAGGVVATLMSSILYAAAGLSITQFPLYFVIGLTLSSICSVTGSFWAAFVVRLFYNLISLMFEYNLATVMRTSGSLVFFAFVITMLTALFSYLALTQAGRFYEGLAKSDAPKPEYASDSFAKRLLSCILSPVFLICVIIFAASLILPAIGSDFPSAMP